jgi:hypothetical protein
MLYDLCLMPPTQANIASTDFRYRYEAVQELTELLLKVSVCVFVCVCVCVFVKATYTSRLRPQ